MDNVVSWFILVILANVGFILAIQKGIKEKREERAENDRFFREHNHTLNR